MLFQCADQVFVGCPELGAGLFGNGQVEGIVELERLSFCAHSQARRQVAMVISGACVSRRIWLASCANARSAASGEMRPPTAARRMALATSVQK